MLAETENKPLHLLAVAAEVELASRLADRAASGMGPCAVQAVDSVAAALLALRHAPFDAIVARHEPERLDALTLARALRGAGDETPVLVVADAAVSIDDVLRAGGDSAVRPSDCENETVSERLNELVRDREATRAERCRFAQTVLELGADERQAGRLAEAQASLLAEIRSLVASASGDLDGKSVRGYVADSSESAPAQRAA